jgi:hypothetical protein
MFLAVACIVTALGLNHDRIPPPGAHTLPPPKNVEAAPTSPKLDADEVLVKLRSFRLPFSIRPEDQARIKWVVLYISTDRGKSWELYTRVTPDKGAFLVDVERDGSYWFAVQVIDNGDARDPANVSDLRPKMKIRVQSISRD